MKPKLLKISYVIILLIVGVFLGTKLEQLFPSNKQQTQIATLNDVIKYTEKYYVDKVDTQKLIDAAINGMLGKLDPHTVYIPAKDVQSANQELDSDFQGIGIEFQIVNDTIVVVSAISGGPSEALGIQSGDRIVKIDGKSSVGINNDQVRQRLLGKAGTHVNVSIKRFGVNHLLNFDITRAKIPVYAVDAYFMLNQNTGYVSLTKFSENAYNELDSALISLKKKGMTQLILDLRGNPGGYLNQAVDIADLFIKDHRKIVYTKGRLKQFDEEFNASKSSPFEKIPLIILVNHGSASASEIVSGAIQDWDRGLIVGVTTFGKGLVQRQFSLPDSAALRLTIAKYYTPSGRCIQRNYKGLKNRKDYFTEPESETEKVGNNLYHTEEKDTTQKIYKTHAGRTVYGGGGITPDYIVKNRDLSDYTIDLMKNNVFYQFMLLYLDENQKAIQTKYTDLKSFVNDFQFSNKTMDDFIKFAAKKGVKFIKADYDKDKVYIETRLKAQIARNYWKNDGWYEVMENVDTQLKKAETLFYEAKDLASLK